MFHVKHKSQILSFVEEITRSVEELSNVQQKQIVKYYNLLSEWNQKINVVSRKNTEEILRNNLIYSFVFLKTIQKYETKINTIADFGTGGGFPGILLAICLPTKQIILVDSNRKKTLLLNKIKNALNLNVEIINARVEELDDEIRHKTDCVTALAFTGLEELIELSKPFLKENGLLFTLKGKNYHQELSDDENKTCKIYLEIIPEKLVKKLSTLKEKTMLRLEF